MQRMFKLIHLRFLCDGYIAMSTKNIVRNRNKCKIAKTRCALIMWQERSGWVKLRRHTDDIIDRYVMIRHVVCFGRTMHRLFTNFDFIPFTLHFPFFNVKVSYVKFDRHLATRRGPHVGDTVSVVVRVLMGIEGRRKVTLSCQVEFIAFVIWIKVCIWCIRS